MTSDRKRDRDEIAATSDAESPLSLNATFDVLAHHYRRGALRFVADADGHTATVDELVTYLVGRAAERTAEPPRRDRIEVDLIHVHLPKLTEAGVIDYDARSKVVAYRRHERLEDILEYVRTEEAGREPAR